MREILFKAKRIDNKQWIIGCYLKRYDQVSGRLKHLIFYSHSEKVWGYVEIDPDTLCQYTGLKDKHGNEIWENDIIYIPYQRLEDSYCKVVFKRGAFIGELPDGCEECIVNSEAEVVGNVFDNADLWNNF